MADRNEFMKGFRSFQRQKGKPPPVKRQETGAPKATPQQVFKPQEHKRSSFVDSFFTYQGMMDKELERINKEAEKAEQDIIKQQQMGQPGAGVQPGAPELAQEGLSPEMGSGTPPSVESIYQQSVPPDLQATAFPQPGAQQVAPEAYGQRADGTPKGTGFLGELQRPDGRVSTELSIGVEMGGEEVELPLLVPTLSKKEITLLLNGKEPTKAIVDKAIKYAQERMKKGLSPFAGEEATPGGPTPLSEGLPFMQPAHEQLAALGDVAGAFGTGMVAFLPSMLGGYLEGTIPTAFPQVGVPPQPLPREKLTGKEKVEAVTEVQDAIAEELSYVPRTAAGRELTEFASWPFQKVQQFATWVSENIVPESQPFLRKIADDTIHLGTYIVAHKTGRLSTKAFKKGVAKVRGIPEEKVTVANTEAAIKTAQDKLPKKIKKDTTEFLKNVKEKVAEKPAWEMTRKEYEASEYFKPYRETKGKNREAALSVHELEVESAIAEGKIKSHPDYPELGLKPPVPVKKVKEPVPPKAPSKAPVKEFAKEVIEAVPRKLAKDVIEEAGGEYIGIREGKEGVIPAYVTFNEKTTGTTIEIPLSEVTPKRIKAELAKKIEAYKAKPAIPTESEMKAEVEAAGAIWGAVGEGGKIDTTPWPATKTHPEGLRNFNSPYTRSTLTMDPSKITTEAIKSKMLTNYVETKKAGGEIFEVWKEGEDAFAQQSIEGVKTKAEVAKTEPTPPPVKIEEITEKNTHRVKSGTKEEVAEEFRTRAKSAPESLSDVPKDQPTWIQVDHEGTVFTMANTADALNFFADKISRLKKGRIGPPAPKTKPPAPPKVSGKRPKVDVDIGETYLRVYTKDTKFRAPGESRVWQILSSTSLEDVGRGLGTYLYRTKYKGRTFYSDGHLIEFRDTAPKVKVNEIVEPPGDIAKFIDGIEKGKFQTAKPTFDTEVGVAIMNEKSGFFISHEYFDYVRSKYGPNVKWEIPEPGTGNPLKFSVNGKLQGYIAPLHPDAPHGGGLVGTPHNILAERFPEGFKPGPTVEAGGLQTMYEGVRDIIKSVKFPESAYMKAKGVKEFVKEEVVDPFRFYPDLPKEYVNDIRVHMVAALDRARHKVYSKEGYAGRIFKDMKKGELMDAVELIYARDEVGRQKAGRGNPELTLEEVTKIRDGLEKSASTEILRAADEWRAVTEEVQTDLVRRGVLKEGQFIEDYAPHAVGVYTPDWAYTVGIPTRIRTPFRSFKQKARGTTKEIVKDADTLLGHLLKVEHTNMIEDFIVRETAKYDVLPTFTRKQKIALFGSKTHERLVKSKAHPEGVMKKIEVVNTPKPGRIWLEEELVKVDPTYKGKGDFWTYTPDQPFSRTIFMTDEGQMALGRYKNVSLIPADIFRSFKSFSESGSALIHQMNLITSYWKSMAILSHYPSFNMNNLIGDTFMAVIQHPQPTKLLIEMETSIKYLMGEARAKPHTGYLKELNDFILSEDVLGASFFQTELPRQLARTKNPLRMILDKSMTVSQMREGINRTAYASTLLKSIKDGTASEMIKAHSWIDTKGLSQQAALGKIAREVLVDYAAVSKGFRRIGRGLLTPFGTWYFHNSLLIHKWIWKNKGKALVGLLSAPLLSQAWNNRDEAARQRELQRPDWIRNKIHFDIGGNADGTLRTLLLQLPQDVLIGTKVFTIATEMSSRVVRGEINSATGRAWTPRDAALRTIKDWGVQEYRGVAYLMAPLIRFYIGLKDRRDPYDKVPIYSTDYNKLNPMQRKWEGAQFFVKTMVPFLGANIIKTQQKKQPIDIAFRDFLDNFVGKEAIGVFDITPKGDIKLGDGRVYNMDDTARVKWVSNQVLQHFNDIERNYIGFRGSNQEFIQSDKFKSVLVEMYDMMGKIDPKLFKPGLDNTAKTGLMTSLYGERLTNMLTDPGTQQNRLQVMLKRAKTDEEKIKLREEYVKQQQQRIFLGMTRQPKFERELMMKRLMEGSPLPWQLELSMPP